MQGREQTSKASSKGKRVLMVVENQHYPQDIRVRQEALALTSAGYEVMVICPAGKGQPRREVLDGVRIYRYPAPPPGDNVFGYVVEYGYSMVSMLFLSLLISLGRGFDYLHTANPPDTAVLLGALYKLFGKRFIFDHHDLSPEMYRARFNGQDSRVVYKTLLLFEKLSCRMADHVIATNYSYKQVDHERNRVPEERISVVRNGPSMKMLQPIEPDNHLRQKAPFIIVYVGAIAAQDGLDYLIRALHCLAVELGRKNDFHCYILGTGTSLESIRELTGSLGLEDNITFTGWQSGDTVKRYISSADLGVDPDPSNEYNDRCTMIKIMEYMALGKPIVAFDLPEHRNSAGEAALYARPNDELDFARQISQLMDDPQLRQWMGCTGKERVRESLAWEHQVEHLLKAYQAISFISTHSGLKGDEMEKKECQIHDIPHLSEEREKITNLTLKQQIKLWLKRRFSPEMKRKLKSYVARYKKAGGNEDLIPQTGGSSPVPLPPAPPKTRFQTGDLVRIRPFDEIKGTLNTWGELKGCGFMDEMEPYCGTVQRVMKPVTRFVDERDYQVKKTRGLYLLEGLICQGTKVYGRCDRSCFFFWREEWLEPYEEGSNDSAA